MHPVVKPLVAILADVLDADFLEEEVNDVVDELEKQGWAIENLNEPTKVTLVLAEEG